MAAQHAFAGDGRTAAQLARAASAMGNGLSRTLVTLLSTTEARGHALAGDAAACRAALVRAEIAFDQAQPEADPSWLGAASLAHHSGAIMHSLHDLGDNHGAYRHAMAALDLPAANVRATVLHQILVARVELGLGEVDRSVATATRALHGARRLRSVRITERLHEYAAAVRVHARVSQVKEWLDEARPLLPGGRRTG